MRDRTRTAAFLCGAAANVFWGFSYLLTRIALQCGTPEILLSFRFVLSFILLAAWMLIHKEKITLKGKPLLPLILIAIVEPAGYYFESYGVLYTNATLSGIALACIPVFAIVFAAFFLKEYPSLRQVLFSFVPIVGVILITVSGNQIGAASPLGFFFLFCTCLCYAAYRNANRAAAPYYTTMERTIVMMGSGAFFFTITALFSVRGDVSAVTSQITQTGFLLPAMVLVLFCSIDANLLANHAAKNLTVLEYSVIGSISTICSMFGGVLLLHEPMTPMMFIGALLIFFGIREITRPQP